MSAKNSPAQPVQETRIEETPETTSNGKLVEVALESANISRNSKTFGVLELIASVEKEIRAVESKIEIAENNILHPPANTYPEYWIQKEAALRQEEAVLRQDEAALVKKAETLRVRKSHFGWVRNAADLLEVLKSQDMIPSELPAVKMVIYYSI